MNYPPYIQMNGNTVANARPMPLNAIKRGEIYVVMGDMLCRVLKIGHTDYPDSPALTKQYPETITIQYVGYRVLAGRWWDPDSVWMKPRERDTDQYALCYFFPWDRCGILYGTPKAKQLKRMIGDLFTIGLKLRGYEHRTDKKSRAIYAKASAKREQWDMDVEKLFNSLADPKRYPKLPPPQPQRPPLRIQAKVAPDIWNEL